MKTRCMQMETTGGHKNVALIPWRNKRDKKVQNKVLDRISVQHKTCYLYADNERGKKRVKKISRK